MVGRGRRYGRDLERMLSAVDVSAGVLWRSEAWREQFPARPESARARCLVASDDHGAGHGSGSDVVVELH